VEELLHEPGTGVGRRPEMGLLQVPGMGARGVGGRKEGWVWRRGERERKAHNAAGLEMG